MTAARTAAAPGVGGLLDDEEEFGIAEPLPPWTLPARVVGVIHGAVRGAIRGDVEFLERLGVPRLAGPLAAVAIPLLGAILHVVIPSEYGFNEVFRVNWADAYTESIPYMALALLIGLLAPTLGVIFVLSHVVFDLVAAGLSPLELEPTHTAIAGRLVAAWLLWLLAVEIPLLARSVGNAVFDWRAIPPGVRLVAGLAAAAAAVAPLVWIWTMAVTYLVRPLFTWSLLGAPSYQAIAPTQETGGILVLVGAVGAAVMTGLRLSIAPRAGTPLFGSSRTSRPELAIAGHLAASVLAVIALGGLISGTFDIAILFLAIVIGRPLATLAFSRMGGVPVLARIPRVIRFIAAFLITYVIGYVLIPALYDVYLFDSEFFPLVITVAIGIIVFEFLLAEPRPAVSAPSTATAGTVGGVLALLGSLALFGVLYLALPSVASADNCSGRGDCNPTPWGAVGGAGAAAAAGGARKWGPKGPPPPRDKGILDRAAKAIGWVSKAPGQSHLKGPMAGAKALTSWQLDMGRQISESLGGDPPRDDFTEIAVLEPRPVPEMPAEGLPPRTAAAMREFHVAHEAYVDNGRAAIISYDRYGGARRARDRHWARQQAATVISFKKQAGVAALQTADRIDAYLAAAREEGVPDEVTTADEIRAYQARLRDQGFSAEELSAARAMGLTDAEIEESRQGKLTADPEREAGGSFAYFTTLAATYRELGETLSNLPDLPAGRRS